MLACISQVRPEGGLFRHADTTEEHLSNSPSPSTLSPDSDFLAMHAAEANTVPIWFPRSQLLQLEMWQANTNDSSVVRPSRRSPGHPLQMSVP